VKITVILSERVIDEHAFKGAQKIRVGRNPGSDLFLDNLGVSRLHCELEDLGGGAWVIRDRSDGRTFVNGAPILTHNIVDGDLVQVGKFSLAISLSAAWGGGPESKDGFGGATIQGAKEATKLASLSRPFGYLAEGEKRTDLLALRTCIGKGDVCDLKLSGWRQPRVAVVLVREESGYRAVDVSPKGDSLEVGGKQTRSTFLSEGDTLVVRGRTFAFHYGSADDAEEA
jgi:FHA domain-containing protein